MESEDFHQGNQEHRTRSLNPHRGGFGVTWTPFHPVSSRGPCSKGGETRGRRGTGHLIIKDGVLHPHCQVTVYIPVVVRVSSTSHRQKKNEGTPLDHTTNSSVCDSGLTDLNLQLRWTKNTTDTEPKEETFRPITIMNINTTTLPIYS